jgi:hypothetical protein
VGAAPVGFFNVGEDDGLSGLSMSSAAPTRPPADEAARYGGSRLASAPPVVDLVAVLAGSATGFRDSAIRRVLI